MTSSRAAAAIWPCMSPTRSPASSPAVSRSNSSVADLASTRSESLTSGHTTKARWPAATSLAHPVPGRRVSPPGASPGSHSVVTGWRPGGISSSVVRSRSPKITMAAVRGIGVAVITSRSGSPSVPLARRVARCSTPNRCCSSMGTAPSDPNVTSSVRRAWVPTTMLTSPDANPASTAGRAPWP